MKQIIYFLGEYDNQEINYQKKELSNAELVDYESDIDLFQLAIKFIINWEAIENYKIHFRWQMLFKKNVP